MKFLAIAISILAVSFSSFSQDKSDAILDKVSKEMKALSSFYVEFEMKTKNSSTGQNDSDSGSGYVKGNKFSASLGENKIISNGMKNWTIASEDKVVYVTDVDEDDDESINPKKLMTIWEDGFKSKYIKEENGKHVINLYPTNPGEVEFHTIILYINSSDNGLNKAIMKTKDGTTMTYTIKKFTKNVQVADSKFVFNKAKYPGYEVIVD